MESYRHSSDELLQKCKHEAKQLLEANVNTRKIHWTHPNFVSFCLVVEEVLSYGTKKRFRSNIERLHSCSAKLLQELSRSFPVARSTYQTCYVKERANQPDYAQVHTGSPAEKRIIWIRTALVEHTLKPIVDEILKKPDSYYTSQSIMRHTVYAEIFSFLLDGPCSLKYTQLKTIDTALISPGPVELVNRHNKVVYDNSPHVNAPFPTGEAWEHVQSLYQNPLASCLYGKNNVELQPPGFFEAFSGYLTLQRADQALILKWLPNTLLNNDQEHQEYDNSVLWSTVLSVDMCNSVAHLHCHRSTEEEDEGQEDKGAFPAAKLILIGYNGIAYPPLLFPQPSSLVHFLEALENGLHPQGCLEPPLWFLKQQHREKISVALSSALRSFSGDLSPDDDLPSIWNQVFRVRFNKRTVQTPDDIANQPGIASDMIGENEQLPVSTSPSTLSSSTSSSPLIPHSPTDSPTYSRSFSTTPSGARRTSLQRPHSRTRSDLENIQNKVSHQLLARYFYSWLSYCRHISRVKSSVAHLVKTDVCLKETRNIVAEKGTGLGDGLWQDFLNKRDSATWLNVQREIYYSGGIQHHLRSQVWPLLLGLLPLHGTSEQQEELIRQKSSTYTAILQKWKTLELTHYENTDPTSTPIEIRLCSSSTTHPIINGGYTKTDNNSQTSLPPPSALNHTSPATVSNNSAQELVVDEPLLNGGSQMNGTSVSESKQPVSAELSKKEKTFLQELIKIDKDIPRCDRDFYYFKKPTNLHKIRNIIASYIWLNCDYGYSQGMCDLLAPLLVVFDDEVMAFSCFQILMARMEPLFPPNPGMSERLGNLQALLQVLESDFFQYLNEKPMGDSLFYCYRWFLVNFKREFKYEDIFTIWEISWAAKSCASDYFEEFVALAILQQYKTPIMDAQLDPSEILNLFTDLAEKKQFKCQRILSLAQATINELQSEL